MAQQFTVAESYIYLFALRSSVSASSSPNMRPTIYTAISHRRHHRMTCSSTLNIRTFSLGFPCANRPVEFILKLSVIYLSAKFALTIRRGTRAHLETTIPPNFNTRQEVCRAQTDTFSHVLTLNHPSSSVAIQTYGAR